VPPMPVQVTTQRRAQNPPLATRSTASIWQHHAWSTLLSRRLRPHLHPRQSAASPPAMRDTGIPSTRCGPAARRRAAARGAPVPAGAKSKKSG
jgi:hypothetical protein